MIQLVLFSSTGEPLSAREVFTAWYPQWSDVLDGELTLHPAQPEQPMLRCWNSEGTYLANLGADRSDWTWRRSPDAAPEAPARFQQLALEMMESWVAQLQVQPYRLGFIAHHYIPTSSPKERLSAMTCAPQWTARFGTPESLEFHVRHEQQVPTLNRTANLWTRFKTGTLHNPSLGTFEPIILVEQDINLALPSTLHVQMLSPTEVRDFFAFASGEAARRLQDALQGDV